MREMNDYSESTPVELGVGRGACGGKRSGLARRVFLHLQGPFALLRTAVRTAESSQTKLFPREPSSDKSSCHSRPSLALTHARQR